MAYNAWHTAHDRATSRLYSSQKLSLGGPAAGDLFVVGREVKQEPAPTGFFGDESDTPAPCAWVDHEVSWIAVGLHQPAHEGDRLLLGVRTIRVGGPHDAALQDRGREAVGGSVPAAGRPSLLAVVLPVTALAPRLVDWLGTLEHLRVVGALAM